MAFPRLGIFRKKGVPDKPRTGTRKGLETRNLIKGTYTSKRGAISTTRINRRKKEGTGADRQGKFW